MLKREWDHFIGGTFSPQSQGNRLVETDPRTGEASFSIARGGEHDVALAVRAAVEAGFDWRDKRPSVRGKILVEIARQIRLNGAYLQEIEQIETGKPAWHAAAEVEIAAQYFEYYGGLVNSSKGDIVDLGAEYHSYTKREPYGVIGVILPWNAPINQAARGIAPALAMGNTVVAKPSEFTSVSLLALAELAFGLAGLPAGILNVVTGTGVEAGASLVSQPDIRKLYFTGSVRAGQAIGRVAAERILPLGLELGGKSPNIVFADADLEKAADGVIKGFTLNAGQICSAGTRCLVDECIHDEFLAALKVRLAGLVMGDGDDAQIGPIITRDQFEKVSARYRSIRETGAKGFFCSEPAGFHTERKGFYVPPAILTGVTQDMDIVREEIFGPLLALSTFTSEAEAIELANGTEYGLAAGLWTRDLSRAHRVASAIEAGQIFVNEYFAGGVETPFGGYKQSGYGREKGLEALHHYTQLKCVTIRL